MKTVKMSGQSTNPQSELLAKLMKEMPEIFSEGKIDTKKLKETLGEDVIADQERYGLTWAGKSDCFKKIQEITTNTLKPCREESVNFDETENLFIEGDNLQVLKVLQKSYYGKVKMIYIDPPYNTGNDFIYNDKFSRTKKEELIANGSIDEDGNVINHDLYRQNTRDGGHFHSNWLNMMYPRLFLARNLLRQDGVIFVSIDDNEVKNLRAMMDEIFGEENFAASIIWKRKRGRDNSARWFSKSHEYLLVYARNIESFDTNFLELDDVTKQAYKNPDNDKRGIYRMLAVWARGTQGGVEYDFTTKDGQYFTKRLWLFSKVNLTKLDIEDKLIIKGDNIYRKLFINENKGKIPETIWDNMSNAANASDEIKSIFGNIIFDTPKPVPYIEEMLKISTNKDDLILDFFAGSGTTAHAVMQLNAEDCGNRKWICVQLPEKCKLESEAAKVGFATIADIAKERVRRVGKNIQGDKDNQLDLGNHRLDIGFKVFKLNETNFKVWNTQIENVAHLEQQLMDFVDNVKPEALTENLLYELIIKSGLELNVPIEEKKAKDGVYYRIGNGELIICLADKLVQPLFDAIIADKPEKIIVLDRAFANNDQLKTNMLLSAEHAGVKEFKVI
jgi:adenine-specific DNA-methyltransferase